MEKGNILGQMEEIMLGIMYLIKSTDKEFLLGRMGQSMKDNGNSTNKMGKEKKLIQMVIWKKEYGRMVNLKLGLIKLIKLHIHKDLNNKQNNDLELEIEFY